MRYSLLRVVVLCAAIANCRPAAARPSLTEGTTSWDLHEAGGRRVPYFRPGLVPGEGTHIHGGTLFTEPDGRFAASIAYEYVDSGAVNDTSRLTGTWQLRGDSLLLTYEECSRIMCRAEVRKASGRFRPDALVLQFANDWSTTWRARAR